MEPILLKHVGNVRYEVFCDVYYQLDIDFDSESDRLKFIDDLESGAINAYSVVKSKQCASCSSFHEVDSLNGILDKTASDALDEYMNFHDSDITPRKFQVSEV